VWTILKKQQSAKYQLVTNIAILV